MTFFENISKYLEDVNSRVGAGEWVFRISIMIESNDISVSIFKGSIMICRSFSVRDEAQLHEKVQEKISIWEKLNA